MAIGDLLHLQNLIVCDVRLDFLQPRAHPFQNSRLEIYEGTCM